LAAFFACPPLAGTLFAALGAAARLSGGFRAGELFLALTAGFLAAFAGAFLSRGPPRAGEFFAAFLLTAPRDLAMGSLLSLPARGSYDRAAQPPVPRTPDGSTDERPHPT